MNRFASYCFLFAASLCGMSCIGTACAEVIYSQIVPTPPTGAFSSNDAGSPTDQKIADNFLFSGPTPVTIRSLRFIGGYGGIMTPPLNALPPDDFRIVFFSDSASAPGAPLAGGDFHVGSAVQRSPTGGPLLNGVVTPIEYSVDLGTGITVSPSTVYWISILNNPGTNYFWAWARAAGVLDQQVGATLGDISTGPWNVSSGGGMYFQLSDDNVPEPGSLGIFLAVVCGIGWMRLRRSPRR